MPKPSRLALFALAVAGTTGLTSCVAATDEAAATREIGERISSVPCVTGHDASYNDLPQVSGALSGRVRVPDPACFEQVLRAIASMPDFNNERNTVVYLVGVTPDGKAVVPEDFGMPHKPLLRVVREHYGVKR